ncbi:MAG TPA: glycoside hydrolase family 3 N-terminal domain-containing protein [Gaiellaceae bacterium]|nr:glycoside hydrolase family 3 N-terminal domain-containing protein [Gaiellaceae bacterium]
MVAAVVQALTLLLSGSLQQEVAAMTPREKAAAVVVAGMPAGPGYGGVLVRQWNTELPRPKGSLVFADQEGGTTKTFRELPPWRAASEYRSSAEAFRAGRETAAVLRQAGVHASFAPVLDLPDGPLGSRHFSRPEYGVAFARGLGRAACAKHFPGLGSTPASTDEARVYGVLRTEDLRPFRAAIAAGIPCVMVGHAIYPRLGPRRASFEAKTYALLRGLGFDGVAVTDSLGVLGSPYAPYWARLALRAGADLVLTTSARDAERIVDALLPLARAGELDRKLVRVLRYRRSLGVPAPSR